MKDIDACRDLALDEQRIPRGPMLDPFLQRRFCECGGRLHEEEVTGIL